LVIHGGEGIGKSTLAASAPSPIFIAAEDGLENIDAEAVEPYPSKWEDVLAALDYVATLKNETVAVDSLDWLEPLCWDFVVRQANSAKIKGIEDFGYGKGYTAALDQWRVFLAKLSKLRALDKHIVLIAHTVRKLFKNPIGDDYEQFTVKLNEKASGLIVEWSDIVGYCCEDVATEDTSGRVKAQSSGKRIIRTSPHPAYLAKTRFQLPARLPLSWKALGQAIVDADGIQKTA
jgi:hypothetical protein